MASNGGKILAEIGAMQTLVENFPMNILDMFRGKKYTSVIEFIIDALKVLAVDDRVILAKIIEHIFEVPNAMEAFKELDHWTYHIIKKPTDTQIASAVLWTKEGYPDEEDADISEPDIVYVVGFETEYDELGENPTITEFRTYYKKKAPVIFENVDSDFINKLEDSVKVIIGDILTAILSCSIIPEIPSWKMDGIKDKSVIGSISIPVSLLDMYGTLWKCPTNEIGKYFYDLPDDDSMTTTSLYRVNDMNAFIWYVLNRGISNPQREKNKMMWDSRFIAEKYANENSLRKNDDSWNNWINSKTAANETFKYNKAECNRKTPYFPIVQLERDRKHTSEQCLKVSISSQTYFRENGFNLNMFQFNNDYLKSIKIFSTKVILSNILEELLNGTFSANLNLSYNLTTKIIEGTINKIIKNIMTVDDTKVSDCYFSFSNEDFDDLLYEAELQKYNAKAYNDEDRPAVTINPSDALNYMNDMAASTSICGTTASVTRAVYDIAATAATFGSGEVSDSLALNGGFSSNWIVQLLYTILHPIIRCLFSPQVMLLFFINFDILGLIDLSDVHLLRDPKSILNIIYKKMLSIFPSLINYIKDKLVAFLLDWFLKTFNPLLIEYCARILLEMLNDWIRLLEEAIKRLPTFDFSKNRILGQIDDVNYADITYETNTPEIISEC